MYINVDINKRNVEYKQYQIFCIVIIYISHLQAVVCLNLKQSATTMLFADACIYM